MNTVIYKYPLEFYREFKVVMPSAAKPLKVEMQNGVPHLWALVDTSQPEAEYEIRCIGTGVPIPDEFCAIGTYPPVEFLGTVFDGVHVWHYMLKRLRSTPDIFSVAT